MRKKLGFMSLVLCFLCLFGKDVYANISFANIIPAVKKYEHKSLYSNEKWLSEGKVNYVVEPEDNSWDSMTYAKQLEASNPPLELLKSLSDEELVDLAMDYPFLCDIFAFNTFNQAMQHFSYTSTIFYELENREIKNISSVIMERLEEQNIDYNSLISCTSKEKSNEYMKELFMEAFLGTKEVVKSLPKDKIEKLVNIISDKYEEKLGICDDFSTGLYFYSTIQDEMGEIPNHFISEKLYKMIIENSDFNTALSGFVSKNKIVQSSNGAWYTYGKYSKYGVYDTCYKYYSGDYTNVEKEIVNECYDNHNWTRLRSASKQYNCHSYCWITTSAQNKYWLNTPKKFYKGNNIVDNGVNKKVKKGQYIVIYDGYGNTTHSLRAASTSKGASINTYLTSTMTNSKLGTAGLYKAPLGDMFKLYSGFYYHTFTNNN